MSLRHRALIIKSGEPFASCKLDREVHGKYLMDLIDSFTDGFVLALNNPWGAGKTTFVKMWIQLLEDNGHNAIYFNSWDNDFEEDPFPSILAALKEIEPKNGKQWNQLIKYSGSVLKLTTPSILKLASSGLIKTSSFSDIVEAFSKAGGEILQSEIDKYLKNRKSRELFRSRLKTYVEKRVKKLPLIIVIDELDRCNPSFAVKTLEVIKHLFSVEGVVFVLSIDKDQLANAVCGFYGSDLIDGNKYLQRFIDLEYNIPEPRIDLYIDFLFVRYDIVSFLPNGSSSMFLKRLICHLFDNHKLSLRSQAQLVARLSVIFKTGLRNNENFTQLLIVMLVWSVVEPTSFARVKDMKISPQEFLDEMSVVLGNQPKYLEINDLARIEGMLLMAYDFINRIFSLSVAQIVDEKLRTNRPTLESKISESTKYVEILHYEMHKLYQNTGAIEDLSDIMNSCILAKALSK